MKLVLIGDGESPHLLKWARALAPRIELWAASSRAFLPDFDRVLPPDRRLALKTSPRFEGGNAALLLVLPRLVRWLRRIGLHERDWLHAHYLSSHGTLAWLARRCGVPAQLAASAWGSDILVAPQRSAPLRWLTRRVLADAALCTSDSMHMAEAMHGLGARELMVFPFGLESMPPPAPPGTKDDALFFANRGLEVVYAPLRVIDAFAATLNEWPQARLVVANEGALRSAMAQRARALGLDSRVQFVGRLDAAAQAGLYAHARWYLSLPLSDSVSVSVLEAMAHGCIPILSDLPANRELVRPGDNGVVLADGEVPRAVALQALLPRADRIAADNRAWVAAHAMFEPAVERFVARLETLSLPVPHSAGSA